MERTISKRTTLWSFASGGHTPVKCVKNLKNSVLSFVATAFCFRSVMGERLSTKCRCLVQLLDKRLQSPVETRSFPLNANQVPTKPAAHHGSPACGNKCLLTLFGSAEFGDL